MGASRVSSIWTESIGARAFIIPLLCATFFLFAGVTQAFGGTTSNALEGFQSLDARLPPRRVTLSSDNRVTFERSKREPIHRQEEETFFTDGQQQEIRVTVRQLASDGYVKKTFAHNDFRLREPERYITTYTQEGQSAPSDSLFSDRKLLPDLREHLSDSRMGQLSFGDPKPLAEVLKEANNVQEFANEKIGEANCVLVKAKTPYGQYSLWLDPKSGYQLRRLHVVKQAGDRLWDRVLGEESSTEENEEMPYPMASVSKLEVTLDNIVIKEIDGYPFIIQAEESYRQQHVTGEVVQGTTTVGVSQIECSPDFDAHGAFVPQIPNGTRVRYVDLNIPGHVWKDGHPVLPVPPGLGEAMVRDLTVKPAPSQEGTAASSAAVPNGAQSAHEKVAQSAQEKVPPQPFRVGITTTLGLGLAFVIAGALTWSLTYRRFKGTNRDAL